MQRNGFTLVEMMIAVALMALFAGATIFTISSVGQASADTASRLASRLAAARDMSIVSGHPVGGWVTASGYGFEQLRAQEWQPFTEGPFAAADWERGTSVSFGGNEQGHGRVRFDTLGVPQQPLVVRIASGGRTAEVRVSATGDVSVEQLR